MAIAARRALNGSLTIIVLTPLTTFSAFECRALRRELIDEVFDFVGVSSS
jgi:hypothetical protein